MIILDKTGFLSSLKIDEKLKKEKKEKKGKEKEKGFNIFINKIK